MQDLNDKDVFIPAELSKAPDYRLVENTSKPLPDIEPESTKAAYLDSLAAISATQIFDNIPGIEKLLINLDSKNSFEIWNMIPNRVLIPEDIDFLQQDSNRVEAIVEKVVSLFDSWLNSEILDKKIKIESWEAAKAVLEQYDYEFNFINIHRIHHQIKLENYKATAEEVSESWVVYPPGVQIELIKTRSLNGGYIVDDYNSLYNFNIEAWAGLPLFKDIKTGSLTTF